MRIAGAMRHSVLSPHRSVLGRLGGLSARTVMPVLGALLLLLLIGWLETALWLGMAALCLLGMGALVRIGPVRVLYLYAGLIWLLPRIYLPGLDTIVPLHVLLLGGLGILWLWHLVASGGVVAGLKPA